MKELIMTIENPYVKTSAFEYEVIEKELNGKVEALTLQAAKLAEKHNSGKYPTAKVRAELEAVVMSKIVAQEQLILLHEAQIPAY